MTTDAIHIDIPRLHTARLTLRAPEAGDFTPLATFMETDAARFIGGPKRPDETWRTLASIIGHWVLRGYGLWAVEETASRRYVGQIGLWNPHGWPEPEIGWWLLPEAWGQGFATEAALAARDHAYDVLGWPTAVSLINPDNTASQAVATRLGARFETIFDHPGHGAMYVWRHPAPTDLAGAA